MNPIQRFYGYNTKTIKAIKNANEYYHLKNLEKIKNRKSLYNPTQSSTKTEKIKRNIEEPFRNYYVKKANKSIHHRLMNIKFMPIKPIINREFYKKNDQISRYKKIYKLLEMKNLGKENEMYKTRLSYQKNRKKLGELNASNQLKSSTTSNFPSVSRYNGSKTFSCDYVSEKL